uniref:Uncharacterized protein n=1 Tax=Arundo donax TaxID=35708 RepID=A0A0A9GD31_ARUDO
MSTLLHLANNTGWYIHISVETKSTTATNLNLYNVLTRAGELIPDSAAFC